MENKNNSLKYQNTNFLKALKCAINGLIYTIKTQRNLRIQIIIAVITIIMSIIMKISKIEWLFIIFAITLVLAAELINTGIETTVDLVTDEINEKAKIAKDVAAGMVLITAINAFVIGCIIFLNKIIIYIN